MQETIEWLPKPKYWRRFISENSTAKELQVGDTVYYIGNLSRFSIKKSTIVAKSNRDCFMILADWIKVSYDNVFDSKEKAITHIVTVLSRELSGHRMDLMVAQHKVGEDERLLRMFEKKLENG